MRAIVMRKTGGPEVLEIADWPVPRPGAREVLVEVHAAGVSFADTEWRRARYRPTPLPSIPGREAAGMVVDVGEEVDPKWNGRRVALFGPRSTVSGTYAEYVACPLEALATLPDAVDFVTGAAILAQGLTAWLMIHRAARIREGQVVLVHAAAGGVGLLAVQLVRRLGARALGVVSRAEKAEAVREAGGEPLLHGDDLIERVCALTGGRGVDFVLDSIGRPTQAGSMAVLAPFGELVHYGDAGGFPEAIDPEVLYKRSLKVSAFGLDESHDPAAAAEARADLVRRAADGSLRFRIGQVLPLAEAAEAHRLIEGRGSIGKIVLTP